MEEGQGRNNITNSQMCPYTANPFYLESFEVPEEKNAKGFPVNPKEVLVLDWIPRDYVGCELNHNEDLKRRLYLYCSTYRCNISDDCYHYLKDRMISIKETVKHNLIVILKTKAIRLFNGIPFKQVIFKDRSITDFPEGEFYKKLNATMQRLTKGFTVPNKIEKVSLKDFEDAFREGLALYSEIDKSHFIFTELPGSHSNPKCTKEDREKCNDANLERLYKVIVGDRDDASPSGNVNFGYVHLRRLLEQGIRFALKSLGEKDEDIKNLMLPMRSPCFQSFSPEA